MGQQHPKELHGGGGGRSTIRFVHSRCALQFKKYESTQIELTVQGKSSTLHLHFPRSQMLGRISRVDQVIFWDLYYYRVLDGSPPKESAFGILPGVQESRIAWQRRSVGSAA